MNIAALINFLRHCFILFFLLRLMLSIAAVVESESCIKLYDNNWMLPMQNAHLNKPASFSTYFVLSVVTAHAVVSIMLSCFGIKAALNVYDHPLYNFSVGCLLFLMGISEFIFTLMIQNTKRGFVIIITDELKTMFSNSSEFTDNTTRSQTDKYMEMYEAPFENGWSTFAKGNPRTHSEIDYIHVISHCCGKQGRLDWDMRLPLSCCSSDIPDDECNPMKAYDKPCDDNFEYFEDCLNTLQVELGFQTAVTLFSSFISLYLVVLVRRRKAALQRSFAMAETNLRPMGF